MSRRGGPKTDEGRAVVGLNSVRHGIMAQTPVLPGLELVTDWEAHRNGVLDSLSPQGRLESVLAERVALLLWRLQRLARYETEQLEFAQASVEADIAAQRRMAAKYSLQSSPIGVTAADFHPIDIRDRLHGLQSAKRFLARFEKMPDDAAVRADDASSIVWAVIDVIGRESELEEIPLPHPLDDYTVWDLAEFDQWTAGLIRECVALLSSYAERSKDEFLEAATVKIRLDCNMVSSEVEKVESDIRLLQSERLLPADATLERVMRYESHLQRQLISTMRELEALQSRRSGAPVPLARLDVSGVRE